MEFKDFDELVKTYYPLNKERTRFLILFNNGVFEFYKYNKTKKEFKKYCVEYSTQHDYKIKNQFKREE